MESLPGAGESALVPLLDALDGLGDSGSRTDCNRVGDGNGDVLVLNWRPDSPDKDRDLGNNSRCRAVLPCGAGNSIADPDCVPLSQTTIEVDVVDEWGEAGYCGQVGSARVAPKIGGVRDVRDQVALVGVLLQKVERDRFRGAEAHLAKGGMPRIHVGASIYIGFKVFQKLPTLCWCFAGLLRRRQAHTYICFAVWPHSQAASRKPQAARRKPRDAKRKPQAASRKPQAASRKPQDARRKTQATNRRPQATSHKPQATSHKPQAASRKPQATNRKPQATNRKPQAASRKPQDASHKTQATSRKPQPPSAKPQAVGTTTQSRSIGTLGDNRQTSCAPRTNREPPRVW